ncbi:MAG: SMP-30/gluconolactonase/LRE family protein [Balneolaceae bacterium]
MKKSIFAVLTLICFIHTGTLLQGQDLVKEGEEIQQITEGHQFTEGPFWHSDGFLLYSDIPANKIYKWIPDGEKEVFLDPSGHSNGITGDGDDGMIIAQHDGRVSHLTKDGDLTELASSYNGKRLNSPNDLALSSDGYLYFTDPPYGVEAEDRELNFSGVYRIPENGGDPELLFNEFGTPNGIVFSPDESRFYVNDTQSGHIMVFEVDEDRVVSEGSLFAEVGNASKTGAADGMVVDEAGNIYTTGPGGIHVFTPDGNELQHIQTPQSVTNLEWGGENNNKLFMTSPDGVYVLKMAVSGL